MADEPEVALWRAVIGQAFADATDPVRATIARERQNAMRIRDTARKWLLGGGKDFSEICHMALLEPDAVRDQAMSIRDGGWKSRKRNRLAA